jgi:hypothetical protein
MTARMSVEEYRAMVAGTAKPTKYRNRRTEYDGRWYDSELQANRAKDLDAMVQAGLLRAWMKEPSFSLVGTRYRIVPDFMLIHNDRTVTIEDTKGIITPTWRIKCDLFERAYGIPITIIKGGR